MRAAFADRSERLESTILKTRQSVRQQYEPQTAPDAKKAECHAFETTRAAIFTGTE
jgi:hypothetical protein